MGSSGNAEKRGQSLGPIPAGRQPLIGRRTQRLAELGLIGLVLLAGGHGYIWIHWRLERIFASKDPSGLTTPLIPFPD